MTTPYIRNAYRQNPRSWIQEQNVTIDNFGGGMNNVDADNVIEDNELSDSKNFTFISSTLMEKRKGTKIVSELEQLSKPVTWIDEYYPMIGEPHYVRATNSEVYVDNKKICDVAGKIKGVTFYGKYFFVDGECLRYYDGTDVYKLVTEPVGYLSERYDHGKDETTGIVNLKKVPDQTNVGDRVFILSASGYSDGNLFGTVTEIQRDNKTVTFKLDEEGLDAFWLDENQPIFFYEPKDISKVVGETKTADTDDGKVAWYQPCINQLADSNYGASYIPANPSVIVSHKSRLFIAGDEDQPHTVFMSHPDSELYFPSMCNVGVTPNGEAIVDLVVFDGALIIGRTNDMFVLYGSSTYISDSYTSDDLMYIKQMDVSTGFAGADCGALLNNYYIFLGTDGMFYRLNTPTTLVEYLMTKPLKRKIDIYKEPFNLDNVADIPYFSTTNYYNEIWWRFPGDFILVYNYDNMAWTYYQGMEASSVYANGGRMLIGDEYGRTVEYCHDEEIYNDCGKRIEVSLATKRFDFRNAVNYKYFKAMMLTAHAFDAPSQFSSNPRLTDSHINVDIEIDYYTLDASLQFNSAVSRFGISKWGIDVFNNRNLFRSKWASLDTRGRNIKFFLTNEAVDDDGNNIVSTNEPFRIYSLSLLYSMRDVR